jgi:hypothetical protein
LFKEYLPHSTRFTLSKYNMLLGLVSIQLPGKVGRQVKTKVSLGTLEGVKKDGYRVIGSSFKSLKTILCILNIFCTA